MPSLSDYVFVADILDAAPKSDIASMEHPLFALRAGDKRVRFYERNGKTITVKPGPDGCATVHDKDLWIYCISQLMEAINRKRDVDRVVRFTAYDFLVSTNRRTDGDSYQRMARMFERLSGTRVETDLETGGKRERGWFGLIDFARIIGRDADGRMVAVEVGLPEWLFRSIQNKQVLTLSRDYFRLRRPLDRRIYEMVRKHCGSQPRWRVSLKVLQEKSGSTAAIRNFRSDIKKLAASDGLPGYRMMFEPQGDRVTFYSRGDKGHTAQLKDIVSKGPKSRRVGSFQRL